MNRAEYYKRYHGGVMRTAKKRHRCSGCPLFIEAGEQYLDSNVTDDRAQCVHVKRRFCSLCQRKEIMV